MSAPDAKGFTSALRDYVGHLADTRTELAIFLAGIALVLVLAEPLTMTALAQLAPDWHDALSKVDRPTRRWLLGAPPSLAVLILGIRRSWGRVHGAR